MIRSGLDLEFKEAPGFVAPWDLFNGSVAPPGDSGEGHVELGLDVGLSRDDP